MKQRHRVSPWFAAIRTATAFAALVTSQAALAHTSNVAGGFVSGFLHPLSGFDHLLAMIAVGLWGAVLGRPLLYLLPVIFPSVMALGGILGMAGVQLPPVELGIALSVLLLGGLVAGARPLPVWAASAIVATFAIFHGFAHGQELPLTADPVGYSAGFVLSTGLLHLVGIAVGLLTGAKGSLRFVPRVAGLLIGLTGVWFLYQASFS